MMNIIPSMCWSFREYNPVFPERRILLEGRLIKAKGGFYDVQDFCGEIIRCRVRGRLSEEGKKLLVGDRVSFILTDHGEGVIEDLFPRKNSLYRPPVANVEQAVAIMSIREPVLDFILLDRVIISAEAAGLSVVICFNKLDLSGDEELEGVEQAAEVYNKCGYSVIFTCAVANRGLEELKEFLKGKVNVLTGPSGVGKSTLINKLKPGMDLKTAPISKKSGKGRHTTRSVKLLPLAKDTYVIDTPGFQKLDLQGISSRELPLFFPEIAFHGSGCYFSSCLHLSEPECQVKSAVEIGDIALWRYHHYKVILGEIQQKEHSY